MDKIVNDKNSENIQENRTELGRKIALGGIWAFWGRIASVLLVVAVNGLASRLLTRAEMGAYFLSLSLIAGLSIIIQIGLNHSIVKLLAQQLVQGPKGQIKSLIQNSFYIVLIFSLIIFVIFNFEGTQNYFLKLFDSKLLTDELKWISIWAILYSLQTLSAETWRGLQKIDHATVFGGLSTQFFTLAFLGLLIVLGHPTHLHTVIVVSTLSSLITILISLFLLIPQISQYSTQGKMSVNEIVLFSWPFFLTSVTLFTTSQADLWLVGFLLPESDVAFYGAAAKITFLTTMPLAIVNSVIPPFIAERHSMGDHKGMESILRGSSIIAFIPALLLFFTYLFFGGQILEMVFGHGYDNGKEILLILTCAYVFHIFAGSPGYTLLMTGHQKAMMIITVTAALCILILGFIGGKIWGITGVAWGTFGAVIIQTLLMWLYTRIKIQVWTHPDFSKLNSLPSIIKTLLQNR